MDEQTKTDAVFQGFETGGGDIFSGDPDECRFFLERVHEQIEATEADLAVRREEDRLKYRKRFGLRSKKDFPFPNAANFSLRLADKIIRKLKPHYLSLVNGVDGQKAELVRSPGMDEATYLKTANVMNYILNLGMPDFEPLMWIAIDKAMMYDFVVLSPYWRRELKTKTCVLDMDELISRSAIPDVYALIRLGIESGQTKGLRERVTGLLLVCLNDMGITLDAEDDRDIMRFNMVVAGIFRGEKRFEFEYEALVENRNAMRVIEPSDFVVARHVKHIQSAELVCEKMHFTPEELRRCRDEGKFDALVCDELLDSVDDRTSVVDAGFGVPAADSKNASQNRSGLIPVRKVCCYAPIGRGGLLRRCVMFYSPDYMERPLAMYAFESDKWPYVQLKIEVLDEGFYSPRGIVSMVDTFDRVINSQFNDMLNRRLITTTPMLTHIPSKVYPSNIRYIPGQSIPVKEQGAIRPLTVGANADVTYERGILFIRAWAEDFMGVPDFAINS